MSDVVVASFLVVVVVVVVAGKKFEKASNLSCGWGLLCVCTGLGFQKEFISKLVWGYFLAGGGMD